MSKHRGWTEIAAPTVMGGWTNIYSKAFTKGDCKVWVTREIYQTHELRWHLSISCQHRYPVWDEIKDARYALLPDDLDMAIILPPQAEYVNLHPNCFHLHEIPRNQ